jgi:hypothetical protein
MNRSAPTEAETLALKKIAGLRSWLLILVVMGAGVTLWARAIPDAAVQIVLVVCAVLIVIGAALYLSFGLRCPRCSSWIPPAATAKSRCTSCGMNLQTPAGAPKQ